MILLFGFVVLLVPYTATKMPEGANNIRSHNLRFRNMKAQIRRENGRAVFPEHIEGTLELDGLPDRKMNADHLHGVRQPMIMESDGKAKKQLPAEEQEKAYYIGPNMTFVATVRKQGGRYQEEMFGFVREGTQNCIWKNNQQSGARAFCSELASGDDVILEPITGERVTKRKNGRVRRNLKRRTRRQFVELSEETKLIKDVVFCAKSFVDRFKAINDGNYDLAVADIKDYVTCLTNEWTYGFQTLMAPTGGPNIAIDTIEVIVPPDNTDFDFIRKDSQGHVLEETLGLFGQNALVREKTDRSIGTAHHATLLVSDPIGEGTLGIAYIGTMCHPYADGYRVDMTVDLDWNAALVGAHEMGHSMGAWHDGLDNSCDSASYLMAAYAFSPTVNTKDTAFTFSPCSADEITNHFLTFGSCLADTDAAFLQDFCLGPRGSMNGASLNDQCERVAAGSTVCGDITKVTAEQCWQYKSVWCCNGESMFTIQHIADGTPCLGQETHKEYFCYRDECVQGEAICGISATTTAAETTSKPTSTTTPAVKSITTTAAAETTTTTTTTPTVTTNTTTTPPVMTTNTTTTAAERTTTTTTTTAPAVTTNTAITAAEITTTTTTTPSMTTTRTVAETTSEPTSTTTPAMTSTTTTTAAETTTASRSTATPAMTTTTAAETTSTITTTPAMTTTTTAAETTTTKPAVTTTTTAEGTTTTTTTTLAMTTTTTTAETTTTTPAMTTTTAAAETTTTTPAMTTTTTAAETTTTKPAMTTTTTAAETTTASTSTTTPAMTTTTTAAETTTTTTRTPAMTTTTTAAETTTTKPAVTTTTTAEGTTTTTPAMTTTTTAEGTTTTTTRTPAMTTTTAAAETTTTTPAMTTTTIAAETTTASTSTTTRAMTTTTTAEETTTTTPVMTTTTTAAETTTTTTRTPAMTTTTTAAETTPESTSTTTPAMTSITTTTSTESISQSTYTTTPVSSTTTTKITCPFKGIRAIVMCIIKKYPECCEGTGVNKCPFTGKLARVMCRNKKYPECC